MTNDKLYKSKRSGDFKILEVVKHKKNNHCIIEFVNTGIRKEVRLDHALEGNVRDDTTIKYARVGNVENGDSKKFYRLYKRWDCMMHRCYNPNNQNYKYYGAIGVTVCDRWFEFSNFIYDVQHLPGYNKFLLDNNSYHLDKDFIQHFTPHCMRVYSPNTCIWMNKKDNIKLSYKLDILFDSGCQIKPLQNGSYSASIVINNIVMQYGVYDTISDIFDNFLNLSVQYRSDNILMPDCYNDNKIMCEKIQGCIDMCKII